MYAPKDTNLWTQTYERDLQDTLTLQSIVARAIAEEIHVKVTPEEQVKLKKVRPVNPRALDAYIEARFHLDQVGSLEFYRDKQQALQKELHKAVSNLDRAIQQDPHYIPPYLAYFDAVDSPNASRLDLLPRAKTALTKALELDETNLEAHLKRARLLVRFEYGWAGAEQEYRRALELNPNSADAHSRHAEYLRDIGRDKDSHKESDLAQALDPAQGHFLDAGVPRIKNDASRCMDGTIS
jgi:tetratricopeptide (TPR) repeat protein